MNPKSSRLNHFNPRSYKRSDTPYQYVTAENSLFQSTLLQEERLMLIQFGKIFKVNFNPRSYKRSDITLFLHFTLQRIFQSTLLQEERHSVTMYCLILSVISIHAPTRGATIPIWCGPYWTVDFNPRSYKRSDQDIFKGYRCEVYFNPRSYKRSDSKRSCTYA